MSLTWCYQLSGEPVSFYWVNHRSDIMNPADNKKPGIVKRECRARMIYSDHANCRVCLGLKYWWWVDLRKLT